MNKSRREKIVRWITGLGALAILGISIYWFTNDQTEEAGIGLIVAIIGFATFILSRPETPERAESRQLKYEQRNRDNLLEQIRVTQVENVLKASLHDAIVAELDLTHTPILQSSRTLQQDQADKQTLSGDNDSDIYKIFLDDKTRRRLVILGEPGAGKTMTMLRLARKLVADAQTSPDRPIPVIFQLSSWAEKRQPIREWMIAELQNKYRVNDEALARQWVADDDILPLFDGLDEMPYQHRAPCLQAINQGLVSQTAHFVLCSRTDEWEELHTDPDVVNLQVNAQIQLHPLTPSQIEEYLSNLGDDVRSLRRVLSSDEQLQEMATSPLLLNIMVLAYQGVDISSLSHFASIGERRKHLFNTYIKRRFETPETDETLATKEQTQTWLKWLAYQMIAHDEKVFLIEGLQPTWLDNDEQRKIYRGQVGFLIGLIAGLAVGLVFGLMFGLTSGLSFGLTVGLAFGLSGGNHIFIAYTLDISLQKVVASLPLNLFWGLVGGAILGLTIELLDFDLPNATVLGVAFALAFTILNIFTNALMPAEVPTKLQANEGVRRSIYSQLWLSLALGLILMPIIIVSTVVLNFGLGYGIILGFTMGLAIGLVIGLINPRGLGIALQHILLRQMLQYYGKMPSDYAKFLDYCVSLRLLVRVGGGYKFMHGLLQDHFAELHQSDKSPS